jgi:hypothetical protein
MSIWSILWLFGIHILWPFGLFMYGYLVYVSRIGMSRQEKAGNPALQMEHGKSEQMFELEDNRTYTYAYFNT